MRPLNFTVRERRLSPYRVWGVVLLAAICTGCSRAPTDSAMITSFEHHKASLEAIVRMLREDKLARDVFDSGDLASAGVNDSRIVEYRRLCEAAGYGERFYYEAQTGRTVFPVWGTGLAIGGATKSIEYDASPPSPLVESLDSLPTNSREGFIVYRHIEGPWYLSYSAN